jgi:hydroxymethylbilane synthase
MAGNVDTRLQRLEEGRADALVLACAGLDRLGRGGVITARLSPEEMLGASAQGALGIMCREGDDETTGLLRRLEDPRARAEVEAERELLRLLRGGCRAPVGSRGFFKGEEGNGTLKLVGRVLSLDGTELIEEAATVLVALSSSPSERSSLSFLPLARSLAERLLAHGAARLIDAARATTP